MTQHSGGATINQGGASAPSKDENDAEFDIAGNASEKGETASPSARERGESSGAESGGAIDMDTAHERAS